MAKKIQQININLKRINEGARNFSLLSQTGARDAPALSPPSGGGLMKNRETDSVTVDTSFVGKDDDVSAIITQLIATRNNETILTIFVLPIVCMGGIRKTTLARKVFNDPRIEKHFEKSLQLKGLDVESREAKVKQLKQLLNGKKYLLVLDDVWNEESTPWN
ncbi:disease resistance protein RGA2-like [Coffea eugenioides]|uniref:disease resistance protein RGA2-like n=1 Tax=Coffea eugenioides TaxID=49369 RepID=UPI000F60AAF1|nr:disease resistance protein RGA2-like [Coffea eugenioides]